MNLKIKLSFERYFLLSGNRILAMVIAMIAFVLLHNFISDLFGFEEPLFFALAMFVIPVYAILSIAYTLFYYIRRRIE